MSPISASSLALIMTRSARRRLPRVASPCLTGRSNAASRRGAAASARKERAQRDYEPCWLTLRLRPRMGTFRLVSATEAWLSPSLTIGDALPPGPSPASQAMPWIRDACYMTMVTAMPRAGLPVLSAIAVPGNRLVPPSDSAGASLPDPRPWLYRDPFPQLDAAGQLGIGQQGALPVPASGRNQPVYAVPGRGRACPILLPAPR